MFLIDKSAVPLQRFICPQSQQTNSASPAMAFLIKTPKLLSKILLVHPVAVMIERLIHIDDIGIAGHGTHPQFRMPVIPGIPKHLIAGQGSSGSHRQTYPVGIDLRLQTLKCFCDIFRRHCILRLKILMKDADRPLWVISALKIQQEVQKKPTVLTAAERNVDVLKLAEQKIKALLYCFIYVFLNVFSFHISLSQNDAMFGMITLLKIL